jgi:hypothetical protein
MEVLFLRHLGTHLAPYPMGSGAFIPGIKRLGREDDHLQLVSMLRMRADIPQLPQYVLMAWCLIKHRDNVTFTIYFSIS